MKPADAGVVPVDARNHPMLMIMRISQGTFLDEDRQALQRACATYASLDGGLSFERCLGLRGAAQSWATIRRDVEIGNAMKAIDGSDAWSDCKRLAALWIVFSTRGPWLTWRDDAAPPDWATPLNRALFWATRHNKSKALSAKQISRRMGHISPFKSHEGEPTL